MEKDHFLVFLVVWDLFPKVFGQVKGWLISELHDSGAQNFS